MRESFGNYINQGIFETMLSNRLKEYIDKRIQVNKLVKQNSFFGIGRFYYKTDDRPLTNIEAETYKEVVDIVYSILDDIPKVERGKEK